MGSAPRVGGGGPRRPHPPLPASPHQPETRSQRSHPRASPSPTPVPKPLPALPLILQPAVIVWARIHLQHQLHGEPCPAGGLRGPRAVLSCPEGWGRGPGLGAGLGPAASAAWACLSASSPLQKPGELIKNRWAGRGGSGWLPTPALPRQPSAAGGFLPRPCEPLRSRRLPHGIRLLRSMPGSTCPSSAPSCRGWGGPPPWPRLGRRWQKSGLFPPKSQPRLSF